MAMLNNQRVTPKENRPTADTPKGPILRWTCCCDSAAAHAFAGWLNTSSAADSANVGGFKPSQKRPNEKVIIMYVYIYIYVCIMINADPHLRDGKKLKRSNFRITLRFQDPQISLGARRQACSKRPKCRRPRSPPPRPQRTLAEGDFPSIGSCMCCMYCIGTFHHCISILKETLLYRINNQ